MTELIRQRAITKWKENALAILFALVLSFFVYFIGQETGYLTADVIGGPQAEFNVYSDIVVAPKGEDGITIFAGKNMTDVASMSMILLFDPTKMTLDNDVFRSPLPYSYSAAGAGQGTLVLTNTKNTSFNVKDRIVDIVAPGSWQDLVLGDVLVIFTDGSQESLSVELPK